MGKLPYHERRERIKMILEEYGRTAINLTQLALEYGVSPAQISYDIDALAEQGMKISVKKLKFNTDLTLAKLRKECDKIIDAPNTTKATKLRAVELLLKATDKETEWAEKYGIKPVVAEKIEMTQINARDFYEIWKDAKKDREVVIEIGEEDGEK